MLNYKSVIIALGLLATMAIAQDNVRVFLIGGQSNGVGNAVIQADDPLLTQARANGGVSDTSVLFHGNYRYDANDGLRTLGANWYGEPHNVYLIGPELTFGRELEKLYPDDQIVILNASVNGSNLYSEWSTNGTASSSGDGSAYVWFQNTVAQGMAWINEDFPDANVSIEAMLWAQGESDTFASSAYNNYQSNLENLIVDLRATYDLADKPFIISGMNHEQTYLENAGGPNFTGLDAVVFAQQAVAAADEDVYFLAADGLTTGGILNGEVDTIHWDAESQELLGEKFYDVYASTVPEPATVSLLLASGIAALIRCRNK